MKLKFYDGMESWGLLIGMIITAGCVQVRQTDPARTATEQLLLSTAADRAVTNVNLAAFAGKRVFLDGTNFEAYDAKYAIGALRDALSRAGVQLVRDPKECEIVIEARSGALSTDDRVFLFGIPSSGIPVPLTGVIPIPELALYKSQKQSSTAKFALLAYSTQTREHLFSSGAMVGRAYNNHFTIIFLGIHRTDVPEMNQKRRK